MLLQIRLKIGNFCRHSPRSFKQDLVACHSLIKWKRIIKPAAAKLITIKYRLLNTVSLFSQGSDLHLILSHLCAADKFSSKKFLWVSYDVTRVIFFWSWGKQGSFFILYVASAAEKLSINIMEKEAFYKSFNTSLILRNMFPRAFWLFTKYSLVQFC